MIWKTYLFNFSNFMKLFENIIIMKFVELYKLNEKEKML